MDNFFCSVFGHKPHHIDERRDKHDMPIVCRRCGVYFIYAYFARTHHLKTGGQCPPYRPPPLPTLKENTMNYPATNEVLKAQLKTHITPVEKTVGKSTTVDLGPTSILFKDLEGRFEANIGDRVAFVRNVGEDSHGWWGLVQKDPLMRPMQNGEHSVWMQDSENFSRVYESQYPPAVKSAAKPQFATQATPTPPTKSTDLLGAAKAIQEQRAADYDQPGGERSMGKTVAAFNAVTGRDGTDRALSEADGWALMCLLKIVRDQSKGATAHRDSIEDLVSYSSLYGEARLKGVGVAK